MRLDLYLSCEGSNFIRLDLFHTSSVYFDVTQLICFMFDFVFQMFCVAQCWVFQFRTCATGSIIPAWHPFTLTYRMQL